MPRTVFIVYRADGPVEIRVAVNPEVIVGHASYDPTGWRIIPNYCGATTSRKGHASVRLACQARKWKVVEAPANFRPDFLMRLSPAEVDHQLGPHIVEGIDETDDTPPPQFSKTDMLLFEDSARREGKTLSEWMLDHLLAATPSADQILQEKLAPHYILRTWRQDLHLTQAQAADVLGVSLSTVEKYEAGRPMPLTFRLALYAIKVLAMSPDLQLIGDRLGLADVQKNLDALDRR